MRTSLPSERIHAAALAFEPTEASIRERFAMAAGALQCVAAMLPDGENHVVHFNGRWAHLSSHSLRRILDLAGQALDMDRCNGCTPAAVTFRAVADTGRCPECGTTTDHHSPECGASWSPDYRRQPERKAPESPGKPDAPEAPDKAFDAIEREISRPIGADSGPRPVRRSLGEGEAG